MGGCGESVGSFAVVDSVLYILPQPLRRVPLIRTADTLLRNQFQHRTQHGKKIIQQERQRAILGSRSGPPVLQCAVPPTHPYAFHPPLRGPPTPTSPTHPGATQPHTPTTKIPSLPASSGSGAKIPIVYSYCVPLLFPSLPSPSLFSTPPPTTAWHLHTTHPNSQPSFFSFSSSSSSSSFSFFLSYVSIQIP